MTVRARQVLTLVALVVASGCGQKRLHDRDAGEAVPAGCPPAALIEELHAAAFHFEHRQLAAGRDSLARARVLQAGIPTEPVASSLLADLERMTAQPVDLDRLHFEADLVRYKIGEWHCLTPGLHDRLHAVLPPI